ncbi:MAG: DUF1616 domain-containing protein [Thermoplasmata archaeon]
MPVDIFQAVFALLLMFFLPGIFLVYAIFPRKNELHERDDIIYRITLGLALSIGVSVFTGFLLGVLPRDPVTGKGQFVPTNIYISLVSLTIIFFLIGWYRGAYPILGRGAKPANKYLLPKDDRDKLDEFMSEWHRLNKKIKKYDKLIVNYPYDKQLYEVEKAEARARMKEINEQIQHIKERPDVSLAEERLEELMLQWEEIKRNLKKCNEKMRHAEGTVLEQYKTKKEKLLEKSRDVEAKIKELERETAEKLYG